MACSLHLCPLQPQPPQLCKEAVTIDSSLIFLSHISILETLRSTLSPVSGYTLPFFVQIFPSRSVFVSWLLTATSLPNFLYPIRETASLPLVYSVRCVC